MRKFGRLCKCGKDQKEKKIDDKYNTIYCTECWNILSWEDKSNKIRKPIKK